MGATLAFGLEEYNLNWKEEALAGERWRKPELLRLKMGKFVRGPAIRDQREETFQVGVDNTWGPHGRDWKGNCWECQNFKQKTDSHSSKLTTCAF